MNGRRKTKKEGRDWGWEEENRPGEPLGCSGYRVYRPGRSVWWALFCFPKQFNMSTETFSNLYHSSPVVCLFSSFLSSDQPPNLKIKAIVGSVLSYLFLSQKIRILSLFLALSPYCLLELWSTSFSLDNQEDAGQVLACEFYIQLLPLPR